MSTDTNPQARISQAFFEQVNATDRPHAEKRISSGESPFRVWPEVRGLERSDIIQQCGITEDDLQEFEQGLLDGLEPRTVKYFCAITGTHPADLCSASEPMHWAVRECLIGMLADRRGHTPLAVERAQAALLNEADDALAELERELRAHTRDDQRLIREFLNLLRAEDGSGASWEYDYDDQRRRVRKEPLFMYERDVLLLDFESGYSRLARQLKEDEYGTARGPETDLAREVADYALRLYGYSFDDMRARMDQYAKVFDAAALKSMVLENPEIFGPLAWQDESSAQFIQGRPIRLRDALEWLVDGYYGLKAMRRIVLDSFHDRQDLMKAKDALNDWADEQEHGALFRRWRNRQAILDAARKLPFGFPVNLPESDSARMLRHALKPA